MPPLPFAELLEWETLRFVLVLTRIAGLITFAPLLSSRSFSRRFRFFLALAMTLLMFQFAPSTSVSARTMVDLVLMLVGEVLIGFVLGTFLQMVFQALQLAGQTAGSQIGLALANVVNPQFDEQTSTTAVIYVTVASLIFLGTGADREMFAALLESFEVLPLGGLFWHDSIHEPALALLQQSTIFAVRIAAPVTVALVLTEIALGFVGRTVPQLNVLSVGFSLRIIVGIFVTMVTMHGAGFLFEGEISATFALAYETLAKLALP